MPRLIAFGLLSLSLMPLSGCLAFYPHRDTLVEVRDDDTHAPVGGARVYVSHGWMFTLNPPEDEEGYTGPDGRVRPRVADYPPNTWFVRAAGYEPFAAEQTPSSKSGRDAPADVRPRPKWHVAVRLRRTAPATAPTMPTTR